jgi:hypothetical protein
MGTQLIEVFAGPGRSIHRKFNVEGPTSYKRRRVIEHGYQSMGLAGHADIVTSITGAGR